MRYLLTYALSTGAITGHQIVPYGVVPDIGHGEGCWAASSPYQWERATRVGTHGLELVSDPVRIDPAASMPGRVDLMQSHGHHQANRRESYDPVPEQLDRITKALGVLHAAGIDIGEAGLAQVEHCMAVKAKYPKRVL